MAHIGQIALLAVGVSSLVSWLITPLVIKLAWRWDLIDDPKRHRHPKVIHTKPTPRAGGLAIFISLVVASLLFLPLDKHLSGILLGATLLTLMGLADDKWNLNPYLRLGIQFLAALAPVIAGIGIAFLTNPFNGIIDLSKPQIHFQAFGDNHSIWLLSDAFAILWIVALMNFVNMGAKGVDGQLPGVVVIAATTMAILSLKFSADIAQWPVIILASITAGAFLGFLPWNAYPQKIMPGFSGSNLAGYLLAIVAILATSKVGALIVVLGVPLVDTGYTIIRRVLTGKSPVWGDVGHLHHRLLNIGWNKPRVVYFYWGITLILGLLAIYLNTSTKLYTMVGVTLFVGGLILWLTYRSRSSKP